MAADDIALVLKLIAIVLGGDFTVFHFGDDLARVFLGLLRRVRVVNVSLCEDTFSDEEDKITK